MKKIFFLVITSVTLLFLHTTAQISEGGKPLTMRLFGVNNLDSALQSNPNISSVNNLSKIQLNAVKAPKIELAAPNLAPYIAEDRTKNKKNDLFRIGVGVPSDISPATSGKWTTLDDGEKIWRLQIKLAGAKAIGLYYDHFYLPQGAKYFLFNENGHQLLGAYTSNNNTDDDIWANEKVQGEVVNLELDLPANVDSASVHLHINNIVDFYRSTDYLKQYSTTRDSIQSGLVPFFPYNGSSPCEVNAICPQGASFSNQREATIKIEYLYDNNAYGASATLMNNTYKNCNPYLLTASHVDPTNSTSNSRFSNWVFYFNYETPSCLYNGADSSAFYSQTMVGAYFKARASYNPNDSAIVGDFLLLQLETFIPVSFNAYFSGWDNSGTTPSGDCISFHHPSGDVKKLSVADKISPQGNFNGGDGQKNTHWAMTWNVGGTEEGSSGGGLFDPNKRLIGDLTGGSSLLPLCTATDSSGVTMSNFALYSKFSLNWNYVYEQPTKPSTRLHDWLDPLYGGSSQTLDGIANTLGCQATGIAPARSSEISVTVYPNPAKGVIFANIQLNKVSNLKIEIYNMLGAKVYEQMSPDVLLGKYSIDMSDKPGGMYMIRISTNDASITEKMISLTQ